MFASCMTIKSLHNRVEEMVGLFGHFNFLYSKQASKQASKQQLLKAYIGDIC